MHERAQYVDGRLVDEKGQFIVDKPKLHPPAPPKEVIKRKNISISLKTWEAWKEVKGTKKWDTIFNEALVLFNKVKDLEGIITQIALQRPTFVQGSGVNIEQATRIPSAKFRPISLGRKKKLPFLEEIQKLVTTLEEEGKTINSYLTPLDDINQQDIQLEDEVLEKKMREAEERSQELREKKEREEGMCP